MRKSLLFFGLVFSLISGVTQADNSPELHTLDALRLDGEAAKVTTRIDVYEQGELTRSSVMDVYVGTDRRSLAVYRTEREAGQKVLMRDDTFWLFMPSSKRALRITPMQKLLGEASVGDVASLAWSEDYVVQSRMPEGDLLKLSLEAARKGLSYQRVTLWVHADNFHPIRADFYLKSGKLAKQAQFELTQNELGDWRMTSMSLQDRVQQDQLTRIMYDEVTPMDMQDKWFTPTFLLRDTP